MKGKPENIKKSDETLIGEIFDGEINTGAFLFGRYLKAKGLVSDDDIFKARMLQKTTNRRIGEIAMLEGYMTEDDVNRLLVIQEETGIRFGDLAVTLGFLSRQQLEKVVRHMEQSYLFIGEALVNLGAIREDVMLECLTVFQRLRISVQQMDA